MNQTQEKLAKGCIIGAFVGDAAGAPLEFASSITEEKLDQAMKMNGGGVLNIGRGQITDDSELAMCQLQVLKNMTYEDYQQVGIQLLQKYRQWADSSPFDIGRTTTNAFRRNQELGLDDHLQQVEKTAWSSKANGALMRITPLVVWSRNLPKDKVEELIALDTQLSHPNRTNVIVSQVYTKAIHTLFEYPGDNEQAIEVVETWLNTNFPDHEVYQWVVKDSTQHLDDLDVSTTIGFVRWGLTLAFAHLRKQSTFREAIRSTLQKGGDTDTNAAIVGGLIGALHGVDSIPKTMTDPVISYEYQEDSGLGYNRPDYLSPQDLNSLIEQIIENTR